MLNNINAQSQWLGAMKALVKSTELQVQPPLLKLGRMQEIYLAANSHLYTSSQILGSHAVVVIPRFARCCAL